MTCDYQELARNADAGLSDPHSTEVLLNQLAQAIRELLAERDALRAALNQQKEVG